MVWQFVVLPGTHTVTVVYRVLTVLLAGPESTTTLTTFEPVGVGLPGDNELPPPPPPPHESADRHKAAHSPERSARVTVVAGVRTITRAPISATPRGRRRWERLGASTPGPRMHAYVRSIEPPGRFVGFANECARCAWT